MEITTMFTEKYGEVAAIRKGNGAMVFTDGLGVLKRIIHPEEIAKEDPRILEDKDIIGVSQINSDTRIILIKNNLKLDPRLHVDDFTIYIGDIYRWYEPHGYKSLDTRRIEFKIDMSFTYDYCRNNHNADLSKEMHYSVDKALQLKYRYWHKLYMWKEEDGVMKNILNSEEERHRPHFLQDETIRLDCDNAHEYAIRDTTKIAEALLDCDGRVMAFKDDIVVRYGDGKHHIKDRRWVRLNRSLAEDITKQLIAILKR